MVVKKESQLQLRFPYDSQQESFEITRMDGEVFCKAFKRALKVDVVLR